MTDINQIRKILDKAVFEPISMREAGIILTAIIDFEGLRTAAELSSDMLRAELAKS